MVFKKPGVHDAAQPAVKTEDEPLPGTLAFVLILGVTFALLWFGMFALLRLRW
jgi:hypothetical protein